MPDVTLGGTAPAPLAHYLKALAVLRLVAEQADPTARGFWRGETFVLRSTLDEEGLIDFFLRHGLVPRDDRDHDALCAGLRRFAPSSPASTSAATQGRQG